MRTLPLIANPAAGGGRCGARLEDAVRRLQTAETEVVLHRTHGPGHAGQLARTLWAEGHRHLLVAGGDGTTFEVTSGLLPIVGEAKPTLGLLPLGTGNSFLRDYEIFNADQAIAAVLAGATRPADAVRTELADGSTWHFINLLSIGFTSAVGALANRRFKAFGAAGYPIAVVIETARLKAQAFPHTLDQGALDTTPYTFLSFSNSRCTGGAMQMAPEADPADGLLDLVRVRELSRTSLLRIFPRIYQGRHVAPPKIDVVRAREVSLRLTHPIDCMVDGEVITAQPTRLTVCPHALEVYA